MSNSGGTSARRITGHLLALAVAGTFVVAAWGKIREPRQFAMDITNYKIGPERYANLMAIFLPWWEVGAAIALARPRSRPAGAILISGMLVMFISAVSYAALYKGLHISCGCWGKAGAASAGWKTIGLDAALLIATILSLTLAPFRGPGHGFEVAAVSPTPAQA
jgi:putative oxidoreductase